VVRRFIKSLRPPLRLTMPALETLAVISYKQPVTAPEIQEIRGVNTSGVLKTLLDKRLITTAGRKEVIGRPILYRTSKEFLMRFGLSDLQELPSLKEFEALAREALGTDEGIATPGAGDESILDGLTLTSTANSTEMRHTEIRQPDAASLEAQPTPPLAPTENKTPEQESATDYGESTREPTAEITSEPPITDSEAESTDSLKGTHEEKSHRAVAGE
jgi:segregation and condensation protein B